MHQKCLLICGYTFFLRQGAFIEMVIDGKRYFFDKGIGCHSTRIELFYFDDNFCCIAQCVLPFTMCLMQGVACSSLSLLHILQHVAGHLLAISYS